MDNENLKKQIAELQERITTLERADNVNSLKYWREKLIGRDFGASDSAVDVTNNFTVSLVTGAGSVTTLDFPDGFIEIVKPNGDRVRVPYYSLSRF